MTDDRFVEALGTFQLAAELYGEQDVSLEAERRQAMHTARESLVRLYNASIADARSTLSQMQQAGRRAEHEGARADAVHRASMIAVEKHAEAIVERDRLKNKLSAERARVDRLARGADVLIHANAVLRRAVEPFAWIGQWMFARPEIPDSEPVTRVEALNDAFDLTREHFKRCHAALEIANNGDAVHERYVTMFKKLI